MLEVEQHRLAQWPIKLAPRQPGERHLVGACEGGHGCCCPPRADADTRSHRSDTPESTLTRGFSRVGITRRSPVRIADWGSGCGPVTQPADLLRQSRRPACHYRMRKRLLERLAIAGLVAVSILTGSAHATTITVDDFGGFAFVGSASSHTVTSSNLGGFDASGSDKLVVSITGERSGTSNNTVSGVTYGGVPLTQAIAVDSQLTSARKHSIWYLDDVNVSGDIVVSYVQSQSGIGLSAVALSNTVAGVAATVSNGAITTTSAGEFVIAAAIANGGAVSANGPLTPLLSSADGSTGSSTGAAGYSIVPTAGSFTPDFAGDESFVAASFQAAVPVPEPSSLTVGLIGLGGLLVARRRRA